MANSEDMHAVIAQAAIQAASGVVRAIREADQPTEPHTRRSTQKNITDQDKLD